MRVGFIGLGKMGKPMAINLLNKGFDLTVHNRSQGVVAELAQRGAQGAASPAEVAHASEIVITCLPNPQTVESIFLGENGLVESAREGQILIDCSTVSPNTSRAIFEAAGKRGVSFLDAPISGGVPGAEQATLTIMVGGEAEVFQKALPVLEALGSKIVLVGGAGAGSVVKLVNQLLVGVHTVAALEALVFGVKAGADPRALQEVIEHSFGASAMFSRTVPMVLERRFESSTDVRILSKDMGVITRFAKEISARLLLGAVAEQVFDEGMGLGLAYNDVVALVQPLERIAGVTVE